MKKRTDDQKVIYDYIVNYIKENGYAPTYREISNDCHFCMVDAHTEVARISGKGWLIVKKRAPRAIKVVGYDFVKVEE